MVKKGENVFEMNGFI